MSVKKNKNAFREIVLERRSIRMYDELGQSAPRRLLSLFMAIWRMEEMRRHYAKDR